MNTTPQNKQHANERRGLPASRRVLAAAMILLLAAPLIPAGADHEPFHLGSLDDLYDGYVRPWIADCDGLLFLEDDVLSPVGDAAPYWHYLRSRCWDYGDAPDSREETGTLYPTGYPVGSPYGWFPTTSNTQNSVAGQPGARHDVVDVAWLGDTENKETDCGAPPSREYDADRLPSQDDPVKNLEPSTATPDQDTHDNGLHPAFLPSGGWGEIAVRISACESIERWYLNVLIDWDFDGRWSGTDISGWAPEWAVVNAPVSLGAGNSVDFVHPVQVGITPGKPWVRVTLTSQHIEGDNLTGWDGSVPQGHTDRYGRNAFLYGETEDHCGPLQAFGRDGQEPEPGACLREPQPLEGCADPEVPSYRIDISTGTQGGAQLAYGDIDPVWTVTRPGQTTPTDAYAIKHLPNIWHAPTQGQWINPYGDTQNAYSPFGNNNPGQWNAKYTYDAEFTLNDPDAIGAVLDFDWWRDDRADPTLHPDTGFYYWDDASAQWSLISSGTGFHTGSVTSVYAGLPPQSTYKLQVGVWNSVTYTGLLVEGEMIVYCHALP